MVSFCKCAAMTNAEILKKLNSFRVHNNNGERAPHKALLLLLALGRVRQPNQGRLAPYHEWVQPLTDLLNKYGHPGRKNHQHPHDPYSLLCKTDNLWDIPGYDKLPLGKNDRPLLPPLRTTEGGLPQELYDAFRQQPQLLAEAAALLLKKTFPESLHSELLSAVGLRSIVLTPRQARNSQFRIAVLRAYEERCAICNYRMRIDDDLIGLEAAHIRWHAYRGPDEISNGLALCPNHHNALDAGIISLSDDYKLLVSSRLKDKPRDGSFQPHQPIAVPVNTAEQPSREHLRWHREKVWRD